MAAAMMSEVAATEMAAMEVEVEIGGLPGLDGMVETGFRCGSPLNYIQLSWYSARERSGARGSRRKPFSSQFWLANIWDMLGP